jgi:serpin B
MLQECVAQSTYEIVDVFLPRFKITWGTNDIQNQLRVLGMPLAFSPGKADFSRINGRKPLEEDALFVSAVLHKAFVNVQEEGTEAVAATAVRMAASTGAIPKKPVIRVFRADHPFLFVIRDSESGTILFAGRVADLTK